MNPTLPIPPLRPLFDRIIVIQDTAETKVGNIHIPTGAVDRPNIGTVVAVGEGRLLPEAGVYGEGLIGRAHVEPLRVTKGDRIIFTSYAGSEVKDPVSGQSYLLMREDDVLAILNQPPTEATQESTNDHGSDPDPDPGHGDR